MPQMCTNTDSDIKGGTQELMQPKVERYQSFKKMLSGNVKKKKKRKGRNNKSGQSHTDFIQAAMK